MYARRCWLIIAGWFVFSLPARTSIMAAANPVGGHYNKAKTVSENLRSVLTYSCTSVFVLRILESYFKILLNLYIICCVLSEHSCHHADNLPSKLKLRNNQTKCGCNSCNNNTIFQKELFSRFLLSTYAG